MGIPRISLSVAGLFISVLLWASDGEAFYLYQTAGDDYFKAERSYVPFGKGERVYALYDNLNFFTAKQHKGPLICPGSDFFVPADRISANIPIRIAIRRPITVQNALANLIYANLKLKKLLDEYETLQEESRRLLTGLNIPYIDSKVKAPKPTDGAVSIHRKIEKVAQDKEMVKRNIQLLPSSPRKDKLLNQTAAEYMANSLKGRKKGENTIKDPIGSVDSHQGYAALRIDNTGAGSDIEKKELDVSRNRAGTAMVDEKMYLPWVYRFGLTTFRYLVSHKIEALFVGLFFFFVCAILSSIRSG